MGHHHRKNKSTDSASIERGESSQQESGANQFDFSSMLGGLNFDNVDFSKIDMNKVKSIMDKIKLPDEGQDSGSTRATPGGRYDPRINLINSLKELMPSRRARTMDNISRFLQISQLLGVNRNISHK